MRVLGRELGVKLFRESLARYAVALHWSIVAKMLCNFLIGPTEKRMLSGLSSLSTSMTSFLVTGKASSAFDMCKNPK